MVEFSLRRRETRGKLDRWLVTKRESASLVMIFCCLVLAGEGRCVTDRDQISAGCPPRVRSSTHCSAEPIRM